MDEQQVGEPAWDVATTPKRLQGLGLLVLGGVILYFLAGFHMIFRDRVPPWTALSYWSMFTVGSWGNSELTAEGVFGKERRPIDLPALFPTKWESGYRYSRSSFKGNKTLLGMLGGATCHRHPDAPDRVIFTKTRWTKVLGSNERKDPVPEQMLDWDCKNSVRQPGGRRLRGTK